MVKRSLFITTCIFATLFAAAPAHAMGHKLFGKACTALYWGIAAGPTINIVKEQMETEMFYCSAPQHLVAPRHDPAIQQYADTMFKEKNLSSSRVIRSLSTAACQASNTITLNDTDHQNMQWALSCPRTPEKTTKLIELRGILQHEKDHLIHKDTDALIKAELASPLIAHHTLKQSSKWIGLFRSTAAFHPISRNILKIPAALITNIMGHLGYDAYHRTLEQRADEGIEDCVVTLNAAALNMRKHATQEPANPITRKLYEMTINHQSCTSRAQRFEERIAELKKKQTTEKNGD